MPALRRLAGFAAAAAEAGEEADRFAIDQGICGLDLAFAGGRR